MSEIWNSCIRERKKSELFRISVFWIEKLCQAIHNLPVKAIHQKKLSHSYYSAKIFLVQNDRFSQSEILVISVNKVVTW